MSANTVSSRFTAAVLTFSRLQVFRFLIHVSIGDGTCFPFGFLLHRSRSQAELTLQTASF